MALIRDPYSMTTKLEAVNYIISQVGAAPVQDLNDLLPDVQSGQLRLNEASQWLQKRGWWFNTERNVTLTPDAMTGTIQLPNGTIKILTSSHGFLTVRKGKAYSPYTQSNVFTQTVCVDLVLKLEWDDLPDVAHDVIRMAAAREHVLIELEDRNKAALIDISYKEAMIELKKDDLEVMKRHMSYGPKFIRTRAGVRPYRQGSGRNPNIPGG